MRRLNALTAGLAGATLAPLAAVGEYSLLADGTLRPPSHLGAVGVFLLVLTIGGFSMGVVLAALWNAAVDGRS